MVNRIPCVSVTLYEKTPAGKDEFNRERYTETPVVIDGVVVGRPDSGDILSEVNLSGKTVSYVLSLPAGDDHDWVNARVDFYGRKWRTIGIPTQFTDGFMGADFPWNKQVKVESFNEQ